jgi:DNA/RNA-binding domain of Phe-tRNA-synthetase-like protein
MDFSVSSDVFKKYPDLIIGVIIATEVKNTDHSPEIEELLRGAEAHVQNNIDTETFKEHPNIAALQEVHRSFGSNPNKFPPSTQALVKRVLKGGQLPSINPIVDLYNVISLKHIVCAGAEDLDACKGDIRLAYADGGESFRPLGEEEEDPPEAGELVYKDDVGIICRKLNWREGDRTKITNETQNAVIVVEGFPPFTHEELTQTMTELSELLQKYCDAQTRIEMLSQENPLCAAS